MSEFILLRGSRGLNNASDPVRIDRGADTGLTDLAVAANVDIEHNGRITRRKGPTLRLAGSCHSMFCDGGDCLFMDGTTMKRLNADYTADTVQTGLSGNRVRHAQLGDLIYWVDGSGKGYVQDGVNYAWEANAYVGPTTSKTFTSPVIGSFICLHGARLYVAEKNILWHSEPFAYSWFDMARNYLPFPTNIRMVASVPDGMFVSDETAIYALTGMNPQDMTFKKVHDAPAVIDTNAQVKDFLDFGDGFLVTTNKGICFGGIEGFFKNLTDERLTYPDTVNGAGYVHNSAYLSLLQG